MIPSNKIKKEGVKGNEEIFAALLTCAMVGALAACGNSGTIPTPVQSPDAPPSENSQPTETPPAQSGEIGKALVVYYSATGNTKAVAGTIADTLGADTFELVPVEPYTSDDLTWTDESSRVSREHDDPTLRAVELTSVTVDNWDSYDTVFIGYPIWWGIAAWPVDSFITANDFTGKTIISFCTSSSSDLGESDKLLAEAAGTGEWLVGQRFTGSMEANDVIAWVNGLGLPQAGQNELLKR